MSFEKAARKLLSESASYDEIEKYRDQAYDHNNKAVEHRHKAHMYSDSDESGRATRDYHLKRAQQHEGICQMCHELVRHVEKKHHVLEDTAAVAPMVRPSETMATNVMEGKMGKKVKLAKHGDTGTGAVSSGGNPGGTPGSGGAGGGK